MHHQFYVHEMAILFIKGGREGGWKETAALMALAWAAVPVPGCLPLVFLCEKINPQFKASSLKKIF